MPEVNFQTGQRVTTPGGEGKIIAITGNRIRVKLNTGEEITYPKDKISDDSNAG